MQNAWMLFQLNIVSALSDGEPNSILLYQHNEV